MFCDTSHNHFLVNLWKHRQDEASAQDDTNNRNNNDSDDDATASLHDWVQSTIVVMNSASNETAQQILQTYQGQLLDVDGRLTEAMRLCCPTQMSARVADINENLFFSIQKRGRGLLSILSEERSNDDRSLPKVSHSSSSSSSSTLHKVIADFEASLAQSIEATRLVYQGSFMKTEATIPQPAHVDFEWQVLEQERGKLFIAFFPLTKEGMYLQLWKEDDTAALSNRVEGQIVFVPLGKLLIVPAHTVHGGGFKAGRGGNLRFHLYLATQPEFLPLHQTNKYTERLDRTKELSDRFVDAPGLDKLIGPFFDTA